MTTILIPIGLPTLEIAWLQIPYPMTEAGVEQILATVNMCREAMVSQPETTESFIRQCASSPAAGTQASSNVAVQSETTPGLPASAEHKFTLRKTIERQQPERYEIDEPIRAAVAEKDLPDERPKGWYFYEGAPQWYEDGKFHFPNGAKLHTKPHDGSGPLVPPGTAGSEAAELRKRLRAADDPIQRSLILIRTRYGVWSDIFEAVEHLINRIDFLQRDNEECGKLIGCEHVEDGHSRCLDQVLSEKENAITAATQRAEKAEARFEEALRLANQFSEGRPVDD